MRPKYEEGYITIPDTDIIVYYTNKVHTYTAVEECHGYHNMDETMIETTITSVDLHVYGAWVNILPLLSETQKTAIVKLINEQ